MKRTLNIKFRKHKGTTLFLKTKNQQAIKHYDAQRRKEIHRLVKIGMDDETNYNYGVCGLTGVGKGTLINSLRGLKHGEKGAAKTRPGVE